MYQKLFNLVKKLGASIIIRRPQRPQVHSPNSSVNPTVTSTTPTPMSKNVVFYMNDPIQTDLIKNIDYPNINGLPKITVQNFKGGGYALGSHENRAASVYSTIMSAINMANQHTENKMTRWAATTNLMVLPEAGRDFNAYYDRRSLRFFYNKNVNGKTIYAADSSDIVAHETGHSILDFHRPDLFNIASLEVFAFHEAFADLIAILTTLQFDEVVDKMLKQNNYDIGKSNCVSQLAEQFGMTIYGLNPSPAYLNYCLREAVNDFKYQDPTKLPTESSSYYEITSEPHDFGRIMLGVFYEILVMMYNYQVQRGISKHDAVKIAANTLTAYAIKAARNTAVTPKFYEAFAKSMLWVDSLNPSKPYTIKLQDIFINRNIISPIKSLTAKHIGGVQGLQIKNNIKLIKMSENKNLPLNQINSKLHDIEVEIPSQNMYMVNALGMADDFVESTENEMINAAFHAVKFLDKNGLISSDSKTPFEIKDGKLIRSHFACSCFTKHPGDPEWGKLFKPENNGGCCGGCGGSKKSTNTEEKTTTNIVRNNCFRYTKSNNDRKF